MSKLSYKRKSEEEIWKGKDHHDNMIPTLRKQNLKLGVFSYIS